MAVRREPLRRRGRRENFSVTRSAGDSTVPANASGQSVPRRPGGGASGEADGSIVSVGTDSVQDYTRLLPYLRCPDCAGTDLRVESGAERKALRGIPLSAEALVCGGCAASYPISAEGVPVMWSRSLKAVLEREAGVAGAADSSGLDANVEVYNVISDHYIEHIRQDTRSRSRLMAAIGTVDLDGGGDAPLLHVDFGCGPGNVLIWTEDWARRRNVTRIGVDVSISNLRNVLRRTDAMAVLGDATAMPLRDGIASLVTEGSVLHHITDWRAAVGEACRICAARSVIVFDNEPSKEALDWSALARGTFESRFVGYWALSFVLQSKRNFRDIALARRNYYEAEVHNQPGRGFDSGEIERAFADHGFRVRIFRRAGATLETGSGRNSRMLNLLLALSGKDWRDPKYGVLTMVARPGEQALAESA